MNPMLHASISQMNGEAITNTPIIIVCGNFSPTFPATAAAAEGFEKLNAGGVLVDFGEIKAHLAEVIKKLDHKFLNELDYFSDGNPSSENIAKYVAETLKEKIAQTDIRVSSVTSWESDDACATYFPDK